LVRRQFGPLHLGSLPIGRTRDLTKAELGEILTISRAGGDGAGGDGSGAEGSAAEESDGEESE
jgi:23S rRNA pseudouridine2605 synthase/16S rRNA pseudouridine516 synthase